MQIIVVKKEKLYKFPFPNAYVQSFWVQDKDEYDNVRELIMLEKDGNSWQLVSNEECKIVDNNTEMPKVTVALISFICLKYMIKML